MVFDDLHLEMPIDIFRNLFEELENLDILKPPTKKICFQSLNIKKR